MVIHDQEPGWDTYVERPGHSVDAHIAITAVSARDFALILIIGGRAPEYLRNDASLISLVREFAAHNRVICAVGHGVQVLTAAGPGEGKEAHRASARMRRGGARRRRLQSTSRRCATGG